MTNRKTSVEHLIVNLFSAFPQFVSIIEKKNRFFFPAQMNSYSYSVPIPNIVEIKQEGINFKEEKERVGETLLLTQSI